MLYIIWRVAGAIATLALCFSAFLGVSTATPKIIHGTHGADTGIEWSVQALLDASSNPLLLDKHVKDYERVLSNYNVVLSLNTQLSDEITALKTQLLMVKLLEENLTLKEQLELVSISSSAALPTTSCGDIFVSQTADCPQDSRPAEYAELADCKTELCDELPRWGILNGNDCSISGKGYKCSISHSKHANGGETVCVRVAIEAKETHTELGSAAETELSLDCMEMSTEEGPMCSSGKRHATFEELSRCRESLCDKSLKKWTIAYGSQCSIRGKGYKCEVVKELDENGGESICVDDNGRNSAPAPMTNAQEDQKTAKLEYTDVNCENIVLSPSNTCLKGRPIRYNELLKCEAQVCSAVVPNWGIANGDACSIHGRGYGCQIDEGVSESGGESLCVVQANEALDADKCEATDSTKPEQESVDPNLWTEEGVAAKRLAVRKMMQTAWSGYRNHAWGENELKPSTKSGLSGGIFGARMGASIVDSLDTLILMNLTAEFNEARSWVVSELQAEMDASVSVFETIIRFIGGLLSAFALTDDEMFRNKALDLASRLLPAFETKTGVPTGAVNLRTGARKNWGWAPGRNAILSEFGTVQLEFEYLSDITGNQTYRNLADGVIKTVFELAKTSKSGELIPNFLNVDSGKWGKIETSLGPYGDSFYEYLLKVWIYRGGRANRNPDPAGRSQYDDTMSTVRSHLHRRSSVTDLLYVADSKAGKVVDQMWHLTCFVGGLYALSAMTTNSTAAAIAYQSDAADITHTCHESYSTQPTKLGPERMSFTSSGKINAQDSRYILRPETVESYFYLWRATHDNKYRQWAWEAVEAIENHCRCGVGYCGIKDVKSTSPGTDNIQQSFFLAETLKYLFLTFSDDSVLPLDNWVFNTEAHPFPINHTFQASSL